MLKSSDDSDIIVWMSVYFVFAVLNDGCEVGVKTGWIGEVRVVGGEMCFVHHAFSFFEDARG